ncbi:MAG: RluA family pseudouridine synthase [Tumebacillaceae bacterium]
MNQRQRTNKQGQGKSFEGGRKGYGSQGHAASKGTSKAPSKAASKAPSKQLTVKEPAELLTFLLQQLSNQGRNSVKNLLSRGQVAVNDKVETVYNYPLQPGQTVTISRGEKPVETPRLSGVKIIHEDDDIIVIEKEAGLLSVAAGKDEELTAYRQLTAHVRASDPQNRIFVVHRLDRDTSDVMMFAKNEQTKQTLQDSWKDIVKERLYVALVEGQVRKTEGTISSWLKESSTLLMYSNPTPNGGQHAVTHYKVLESNKNFSLLEVHLETGRKNQIRVHMQDIGHPIVGDKKYGAKTKMMGRLGLHARVLSFEHPTTGKLMRFETKIPKLFVGAFRGGAAQEPAR